MAGRKKAGVEPGPAEDLAFFLRRLRRRPDGTDLTYRQLADSLGGVRYCSLATLSRADRGGDSLPRPQTVRGYVTACGGGAAELEQARRLLTTAKRRHQREKTAATYADPNLGKQAARRRHPTVAPHPDYIRNPIDFQLALRSYRRETGSLSVRGIARNAEEAGFPISKSAVDRMLTGPRSFPTWDQVQAVLIGCRPHRPPDLGAWASAWRRVFARPTAVRAATRHIPWAPRTEQTGAMASERGYIETMLERAALEEWTRAMLQRASDPRTLPALERAAQEWTLQRAVLRERTLQRAALGERTLSAMQRAAGPRTLSPMERAALVALQEAASPQARGSEPPTS
ncbi:hypothetical protein [Kitasatospora griseola]|uniref:hypothetical protein n=1 Tax=Kitasatospora griseola TaxID=2064 RepID=UPI003665DAB5